MENAYPVFRAMCNEMIATYPKVFEAYQLSSKIIKVNLKKSWKDGRWAETIDSSSCAIVLQRTITIYTLLSNEPDVNNNQNIRAPRPNSCYYCLQFVLSFSVYLDTA